MVKSTTFLQHELKNLHCIYEIFLFQFLKYDCFKFFARRQEKKARVIELSGLLASGAITACSRQCHLYLRKNLFEELSCHLSSFFRSFGLFQFARVSQWLEKPMSHLLDRLTFSRNAVWKRVFYFFAFLRWTFDVNVGLAKNLRFLLTFLKSPEHCLGNSL